MLKLKIFKNPLSEEHMIRMVDGDNFVDFTVKEAMDLSIGLRDALVSIQEKLNNEDTTDSKS